MPRINPFGFNNHKTGPISEQAPISVKEIVEILNRHDANGDKQLSKAELKKAFAELGAKHPTFRTFFAVRAADADGDGLIDLNNHELDNLVYYIRQRGYNLNA